MTTTGKRNCMLAMVSGLAAPVRCSAIKKSLAARTPLASPLGSGNTVGLPAPAANATWSNPKSNA